MGVAIPLGYVEDRASGALVVDGSLRFAQSNTQYLTRTPSSNGDRTRWTVSLWCKRHSLGGGSGGLRSIIHTDAGSQETILAFWSDDAIFFWDYNSAYTTQLKTVGVAFRDVSSWYHIVLSVDTTQSTDTERIKLYVNNVRQIFTNVAPHGYIAQNTQTRWNSALISKISGEYYKNDCSITNIYNIDGQALDPSYFGYTDALTNTWRPKKFKPAATPNDGTTWSSAGNFSGNVRSQGDSYGPPKMFNGIIGNESTTGAVCFAPYSSDSTCTWTSPTTFTGLTSLRLYVDLSGTTGKLTVNGVDYSSLVTALSGGDGWITIPQSSLSTISFGYTGGINSATGIAAVEVNGVTLLDSDTTNIGLNGFYLPFDGSAPIGQDQSGRGNNWTPVNFGGSNTLEKATGALPILNTDGGGKVARVGVRTDSSASSLVLALPLVGIKSDFSNAVNSGTSNKAITANGDAAASSAQSNFYGGSFAFDGTGDYLQTTVETLSGDFCVEGWWYPSSSGQQTFFTLGDAATSTGIQLYRSSGTSNLIIFGSAGSIISSGVDYTLNKWQHFALTRSGTSLRLFKDGIQIGSTVTNSTAFNSTLRIGVEFYSSTLAQYLTGYVQDFRVYNGLAKYTQNFIPASTDPDILPDTPSGVSYTSNLTQITDGAVAFGSGRVLTTTSSADFNFGTGDFTIEYFLYRNSLGSNDAALTNYSQVSSGYFICLHSNSTDAYLFLNGSTVTSGGTAEARKWIHYAYVRSGTTCTIYKDGISIASATSSAQAGATNVMNIGAYSDGSSFIDGFISNLHIVKGTALYTSNFTPPSAPITSVANTKLLCCKSNSSATAADVTPGTITANGNAAATNFNPFTVNINAVRGKQSGWATLNPLDNQGNTLSNGNLVASQTTVSWYNTKSNISVSSGKWYYEATVVANGGGNYQIVGVFRSDVAFPAIGANGYMTFSASGWGVQTDGNVSNNNSFTALVGAASVGDTLMIAFDIDNTRIWFGRNGIWYGSPATGSGAQFTNLTSPLSPAISLYSTQTSSLNFGQKPFKFPPPAGFQPLALANTPRPTIVRPDQFVGVTTYTGNSTNGRQISVGIKPDFVWIKRRNGDTSHALFDVLRGTSVLQSNSTAQESDMGTPPIGGYVNSFDAKGFTLANGSTNNTWVNETGYTYVAWAWKAGGNSNTYNINDVGYATASAAGLTAGSITPTGASVNTKSGFSIITYNGAGTNSALTSTISHGLTQAPTFMIVKARTGTNAADDWFVYHKSIGPTKRTRLNLTNAADTQTWMGDTEPTSSLITLNQGWYSVNYTGHTHILYAWTEIPGFSKFGSYTGNGSADGPMVVTGFRPRWLMIKQSSASGENWRIFDTSRDLYNAAQNRLLANSSAAEAVGVANELDILSNGFKLRSTDGASNGSGATYIYAAFAETPTQNLYGAQANAR